MAWTTARTWVASEVPTAAIFNAHVRDNLNSLFHLEARKATEKDIVNTTSLLDLLNDEITIPASAMGATGAVRFEIIGDYLNDSGAGRTLTLEVRLGATTLWKDTSGSIAADTSRRPLRITGYIGARNATNSQFLTGLVVYSGAQVATTGIGDLSAGIAAPIASAGASAVDMTSAQTLKVLAEHSAANANLSVRCQHASIEVLP